MIIYQSKAYKENEHCSNFEKYLDISYNAASHIRVTHVHILQKHIMKSLPCQKKLIIFQSKDSTEKMNTAVSYNST